MISSYRGLLLSSSQTSTHYSNPLLLLFNKRGDILLPLQNLRALRDDMRKKGWTIDSFRFPFNGVNYIVLVILYLPGEKKDQYALVKLDFLHPKDFKYYLPVPANSIRLFVDDHVLRDFFRLPELEFPGNAILTLIRQLGYCTPTKVNTAKHPTEKEAIIYSLSDGNSEDAEKLYCFAVKRNPVLINKETNTHRQLKRSAYNDHKTKILRSSLYQKLGKDDTISFCYSNDPTMDHPDEVIIANWLKKKEKEQALQLV